MELKKLQKMLDSAGKQIKVLHIEKIGPETYWIVYTNNLDYIPVIPLSKRKTLTEDEKDVLANDCKEAVEFMEE